MSSSIRSGRASPPAKTCRRRSASPRAAGGDLAGAHPPVLDRGAPIPDDADPGRFGASRRSDVAEVELEPDGGDLRGDRVIDDRVEEVAATEDVGEVDVRRRRNVRQVVVCLLAVDDGPAQLRIHRDDPEALAAQVARHGVARPCGIGGVADDGDGPLAREEVMDEGGVVHYLTLSSRAEVLNGASSAGSSRATC